MFKEEKRDVVIAPTMMGLVLESSLPLLYASVTKEERIK